MSGKKPELLLPAGDPECLKTALRYGADAVYIGGEAFGLRAKAENFNREQMAEGIRLVHDHEKKVYVTVNIFAHDRDLDGVRSYLSELSEMRPDALLISDPGIFSLAKELCPEIPRHISTQANNTNAETCRFWHALGAERIVLARELSMEEIRGIRESAPAKLELEAFVHGAMCMAYSGRCLLSNYFTGRDANQGACTHPCRWTYAVVEESRPGERFPVEENERGTFLFHSKDLCMIEHIPELTEAGVDSFKVEGRMKSPLYVAAVARAYRRAIDDWFDDPQRYRENLPYYLREVEGCAARPFSTGFYFGRPDADGQIYETGETPGEKFVYLGIVRGTDPAGRAVIEQKNKFAVGDALELMKPDGRNVRAVVRGLYDAAGTAIPDAPHPKQELHLELEAATAEEGDILRKSNIGDGDFC